MKYCCILSSDGYGGVWSVVRESLIHFQQTYDVYIVVYCHKKSLSEELINFLESYNFKYKLFYIKSTNGWLADFEKLLYIRKLKLFLNLNQDVKTIIHSHDSFISGLYLYFLKGERNTLFTTFHGTLILDDSLKSHIKLWVNKNIRLKILKASKSHLISCDPFSVPIIKKYFNNKLHLDVAINGVQKKQVEFSNRRIFTVSYISRFHPLKGWDVLASAIEMLNKDGIKVRVVFAGNGECENEVKDWCISHKDYALFLGHVSDVPKDVFTITDLHVLPTKYPEGLPMIILETMSCGIPTISTRCGSIGYVIENMNNGILIEPNEVDLASAIDLAMTNKGLMEKMKINCISKWEKEFSSEAMANRYIEIFSKYI